MVRLALAALLGLAIATGKSGGQQPVASSTIAAHSLRSFLRTYLSSGPVGPDITTRISVVSVKAKDMTTEVQVVYVSGRDWCGSGGCTLLILVPHGPSFKVLGRLPIVQLPIRLLPSARNRYPNFGVLVAGGGIQPRYEAEISFDGTTYPGNPSVPPARPLPKTEGRIIISTTADSTALYE